MQKLTEVSAGAGTVVSGVAASATWLVTLNEVLQVVATLVAILAGLASGYYYFTKARREK